MIRHNHKQFWKPMTALNRLSKSQKEAELPTVTPPPDMIMQYKNDDGKQVKIINGKEVLKDPKKTDLTADILKAAEEKEQKSNSERLEKMPEVVLSFQAIQPVFTARFTASELVENHFTSTEFFPNSASKGFFHPPQV